MDHKPIRVSFYICHLLPHLHNNGIYWAKKYPNKNKTALIRLYMPTNFCPSPDTCALHNLLSHMFPRSKVRTVPFKSRYIYCNPVSWSPQESIASCNIECSLASFQELLLSVRDLELQGPFQTTFLPSLKGSIEPSSQRDTQNYDQQLCSWSSRFGQN